MDRNSYVIADREIRGISFDKNSQAAIDKKSIPEDSSCTCTAIGAPNRSGPSERGQCILIIFSYILSNYQKFCKILAKFCRNLPEFFANFSLTLRSIQAAFRQHSGIGTSSGGRCMRPDAPFLPSSCARPQAAVLRELRG